MPLDPVILDYRRVEKPLFFQNITAFFGTFFCWLIFSVFTLASFCFFIPRFITLFVDFKSPLTHSLEIIRGCSDAMTHGLWIPVLALPIPIAMLTLLIAGRIDPRRRVVIRLSRILAIFLTFIIGFGPSAVVLSHYVALMDALVK
jgi:hypothetical protein